MDEGNKGEDSWRMGEDPQNCALGYLVGPSAKRGPIPYPGGSRTDSEGLGIEGKPDVVSLDLVEINATASQTGPAIIRHCE